MKIRNGFVSNSSSASFVLAFPKDHPVSIDNIENWFGSLSDSLSPEDKGIFTYLVWRSQYFDENLDSRDWTGTGEEYDHHICSAPYRSLIDREVFGCPGWLDYDSLDLNQVCKSCKYHSVEKRYERGDDYYEVLDLLLDPEQTDWLESHKDYKIVYLEVDDNEPTGGVPYDVASHITSGAECIFTKTSNALVLGGK